MRELVRARAGTMRGTHVEDAFALAVSGNDVHLVYGTIDPGGSGPWPVTLHHDAICGVSAPQ